MIHTGDISHLSQDEEFDNADQLIKEAGLPVFYVPGEHDVLDDERGRSYLGRYGKNATGAGWQSFDYNGVHYIGLVNVMAPLRKRTRLYLPSISKTLHSRRRRSRSPAAQRSHGSTTMIFPMPLLQLTRRSGRRPWTRSKSSLSRSASQEHMSTSVRFILTCKEKSL